MSLRIGHLTLSNDGTRLKNCDQSATGTIVIPDSVTFIDLGAFYGCTGLTSVVIPDSVKDIDDDAFNGCTGLTELHIRHEHPEKISITDSFDDCLVHCTLYVPAGSEEEYRTHWYFRQFKEILTEK